MNKREREMEKEEKRVHGSHVLVVPFPIQGHVNPMLQFSKRLVSKGLKVTLAIFSGKELIPAQASSVTVLVVPDGFDEIAKFQTDIDAYMGHFQVLVSSKLLPEVIAKQRNSGIPVSCLVYDSVIPWALDIAEEQGIPGASFFTQSSAVNAIYCYINNEKLRLPVEEPLNIPGVPQLKKHDLPSLLCDVGAYPSLMKLVVGQFSNLSRADYVLFNSFNALEEEVVKWIEKQWPVKTIGPTIPSMYMDKRLEDDKDYGLSLFKPDVDGCIKWLDSREPGSVVYVSFGSLAALGEEQMEELAWGLKRSNCYFLWVVRESEEKKLPSNFVEETSEKGLVVHWSPQLEVLAHKATGCFVTHCGWNSTLEAVSLGVPMVAMPQWTDQPTNAKFVADIWKVGVRVKVNEQGIVTREEIENCIWEVMEGERGTEIKRNSEKWKILATEAVDEGGSSDKNIEELVAKIVCS